MKNYIALSRLIVAAALAFGATSLPASASVVAITSPNSGANIFHDEANWTVGYEFKVGTSPLLVSALGVWDQDNDGLAVSHQVGIWATNGTLVANLTISGGTLVGQYRYAPLGAAVLLTANENYRIGSLTMNDGWHVSTANPADVGFSTPNVNFVQRITNFSPVFGFPTFGDAGVNSAWDFPNFQYDVFVIPEPSTSLLFGVGGLLIYRRRPQQK